MRTGRCAITSMLVVLALGIASGARARARVLKIGTAAPRGTPWAKAAEEMGARFAEISHGRVELKVYPGVVGDEPTILRKMRVGQLQGALFTSTGLSLISREPMALQLPMVFDSYEELDAVRQALEPELAAIFEKQGFVLLTWGDAGWLYFFTKKPARSLDDVKGLKTWMWANDPHGVKMFEAIGFTPVVLSSVDLVPSLQTGMIEAFPSTPMVALATQAYSYAPNVVDVPWAPVIGAILVTKESWDQVPDELKPELRKACDAIGSRLRSEVRAQSEEAMALMQKNGLRRHAPSAEQLTAWRRTAEQLNATTRGQALDAALVDRVMALRDQRRQRKAK
ncbi:MAG: TRAP transporter substrate-binding protein DctP [Pseudomonadota bacterium]